MSEQMRKNDRVIRKTQREVERERADLERQEKKLVSIIFYSSVNNIASY